MTKPVAHNIQDGILKSDEHPNAMYSEYQKQMSYSGASRGYTLEASN